MQICYLSTPKTILLFFLLWFIFQTATSYFCQFIPDKFLSYSAFLFRERKWEKGGKIYKKIFRVNKWKGYLPDGGAMVKGGYAKKSISDFSKENLNKFLIESCRAEIVHLIAILPFWVFGLFAPPIVIPIMLIYALAVNMPCVIVQRYNRPRFIKLLHKTKAKEERKL